MGSPRPNRTSQLARRRGLFDSSVSVPVRRGYREAPAWPLCATSGFRPFALAPHHTETLSASYGFRDQMDTRNSASHTAPHIIVALHTAYHLGGDSASPGYIAQMLHGNVDMIQLNLKTIMACVQRGIDDANIVLN
jgi:hypothetical protein